MRRPYSRATCAAVAGWLLAAALLAAAPPASAHGGSETFHVSGAVYSVAWNKQGTQFAAATASGNITLYDGVAHSTVRTWHAHEGPINEVAFSPDGAKIASASGAYKVPNVERTLKVWDLNGGLLLNISGHYDWVTSVAWSPDGSMIASSSGVDDHDNPANAFGEVMFWNASTGGLVWNASPLESYPARIAWAPDGHALAAQGHLNDLWLLDPRAAPRTMELINHSYRDPVGHASHGWAVTWSPDSRFVLGGYSYDSDLDGATDVGPLVIYDTQQDGPDGFALQAMRGDLHARPAEWVGWDSTRDYIASCSGTDLLDTQGAAPVPGQDGKVDAGELVVWNYSNSTGGRLKAENVFIFGGSWCSSLAWRPGNLTLAAGNADGTVKLYILDEDGDGCFVWVDAAPQDASTCSRPPQAPSLSFLEAYGLYILLASAAAVGALGVVAARRSSVRPEPERTGRRESSRARSNGRRRSSRRR